MAVYIFFINGHINTSRGAILDTDAYLAAHENIYWCLDVCKAMIATPHIAEYSVQSKIRGIDQVYRFMTQEGWIKSQPVKSIAMEKQVIANASQLKDWREVVLQVLNPFLLTRKMKTTLLGQKKNRHLFR